MGLTFTITESHWGVMEVKDIVEGGSEKVVTHDNKKDYVDAYVSYMSSSDQ